MTARELRTWADLYAAEPWGEERDAGNADALANVLVGLQTPKGKTHKWRRYTPEYRKPRRRAQTLEAMKAVAQKFTSMIGARRQAERKEG
ncbi:MAG: hypothetical protein AAGG38_07255 [Planctomycetota bacterium]